MTPHSYYQWSFITTKSRHECLDRYGGIVSYGTKAVGKRDPLIIALLGYDIIPFPQCVS